MAAEVGFDMKIRVTEFATSLKQAEAGEYQAFLIGWSGRTDPDGNLYIFYGTKAPQNNGGYCNPEVDKLLDEARTYSEPAKRKAIYEKVAKILQRGRLDPLPLSPQGADRAHGAARGLSPDAGRAGARGGAEAEVTRSALTSPRVRERACPGLDPGSTERSEVG